jgi:Dockerin type I domain
MFSPTIPQPGQRTCPRWFLFASGLVLILTVSVQPLQAAYVLDADPNFSFGINAPDAVSMAAAIQFRLGVPISVVTSFQNENTAFAPVVADSQMPPNYVYGPSPNGVIKNLNVNSPVVTGLTSGELRSAGFDTDFCGEVVGRFVLRVFSTNQFYDVLVRFNSCSSIGNVLWSFYQISSPRPTATAGPTPSPTPVPVQLVSTVSRQMHGLAGTFDIDLPFLGPPGIECRRTTGAGGSYTIVYTFDDPLSSVSSATVTSGVGHVQDSGIGLDPHQYIVNLVNVTNAQSIVVTLNFVQDSAGHASDAVNAQMSVLIGDVGANGNVGSGDVKQVKAQVGHPVTAANFRDDVNHDGFINGTDVSIVQKQRGSFLPQ